MTINFWVPIWVLYGIGGIVAAVVLLLALLGALFLWEFRNGIY